MVTIETLGTARHAHVRDPKVCHRINELLRHLPYPAGLVTPEYLETISRLEWILIAIEDGVILGMLTIVRELMLSGREWRLADFVVDPLRRNGGIGGKLLDEVRSVRRDVEHDGRIVAITLPEYQTVNSMLQRRGFVLTNNILSLG